MTLSDLQGHSIASFLDVLFLIYAALGNISTDMGSCYINNASNYVCRCFNDVSMDRSISTVHGPNTGPGLVMQAVNSGSVSRHSSICHIHKSETLQSLSEILSVRPWAILHKITQ